jgi:hypothetical protein
MEEIQINISDKTVYRLSCHKTNKMYKLVHWTLNTTILYNICDIIVQISKERFCVFCLFGVLNLLTIMQGKTI